MDKVLYIIRGLPSSGKSTLGNEMVGKEYNIAADDYFYTKGNGTYAFDRNLLYQAHSWCFKKLESLMEEAIPKLALSNTSTRERDVNTYIALAKKHGYKATVLTVEKWHDSVKDHNVTVETMVDMEKQLRNSIKLA